MTPSCLSAATVLSNFSVTDKLRCAFLVQFSLVFTFNKQLLDEVEHDIMNYIKTEVCRRLRQIIQTRGFDNSWYHAKTEFNNCFIIHFLNNRLKKTFICWKNGFISKLRWKWRKYGAGTRQLDKAVMDKRFVHSLKLKDSLFIANFTVCIVEDLKVLSGTRLGQDVFPGLRSKWYENSFEFPNIFHFNRSTNLIVGLNCFGQIIFCDVSGASKDSYKCIENFLKSNVFIRISAQPLISAHPKGRKS